MIKPLSLPDFDAPDITYGFFGRQGGVSEGIYSSLNCRNGSNDDLEHVLENRRRVSETLGSLDIFLHNPYQVHGNDVHVLHEGDGWTADSERPQVDALVTRQPGLAIGVLTADCAPILFYGRTREDDPVVAASHAGWKGGFEWCFRRYSR